MASTVDPRVVRVNGEYLRIGDHRRRHIDGGCDFHLFDLAHV